MKLELKGVSKTFHRRTHRLTALEDISLEVREGEFICIIRPSGCGNPPC